MDASLWSPKFAILPHMLHRLRVRDPETGQEHALHAAVQGSLVDVSLHLLNNTLSRR